MAQKKVGKSTIKLKNPPTILESASIVGVKEGQGPLSNFFDKVLDDDLFDEDTWEKAESKLQKETVKMVMQKAKMTAEKIDYIFAGDLLNQCAGSHYAQKDVQIPFFGLYGACSTMAESLSLASMTVDGGFANYVLAATSSHFCSSEKQFRYPLEYGGQRPPTAQWTVTGSGSVLVSSIGNGPFITHITTGKIIDMGINDANNMGAAMAPAAAQTIVSHFKDTGFEPSHYDMILTGDLAYVGSELVKELVIREGIDIYSRHNDCGCMIFYPKAQDVHSGGSGCGCSASVLCGHIIPQIKCGNLNRVLFVATGALMSPISLLQGENIPCIAHAVSIERSVL